MNKCEYCGKIFDSIDINLVLFCDNDCKNDFINDYINDNIHEIIRDNIDTARECLTPD